MRSAASSPRFSHAAAVIGATVLAIGAAFLAGIRMAAPPGPPPGARAAGAGVLAVLPFEPQGEDPDLAFFGIGLADAIINQLSRAPGLTVRPMSAALGLGPGALEPISAGRRLAAGAVLTGTYEQAEGRFRVTASLLDVATGSRLWQHALQTDTTDPAQVEESVVRETLGTLLPRLRPQEGGRLEQEGSRDSRAHYLYLLARGKMATLAAGVMPEAVELLEEAVRIDPSFAQAHAALAMASQNMFMGGMSGDSAWVDRALAASRRAIHLAPESHEGHLALGYALMYSGDPVGGTRATLESIRLQPRDAPALCTLGLLLAGAGAAAPARTLRERAIHLDPSTQTGWLDVHIAVLDGDVDRTIARLEGEVETMRTEGRSAEVQVYNLGYLSFEKGDAAAGLRWAAMMETISPSAQYADMIRLLALARRGDLHAVRRIVERHSAAFSRDWEYCLWVARALAAVGDAEASLGWLQRSARLGGYHAYVLERCGTLDPVRADPRFDDALTRMRERSREMVRLAAFAGFR